MLVIPTKIFGPSFKAGQLLKRTYACWLHYIIYGKTREVMMRFIPAVFTEINLAKIDQKFSIQNWIERQI